MGVISGQPVLGDLQSHRIGRDEMVIAARASAPVAQRRRIKPDELREETWILREEGSDTRRHLDGWLRRNHLAPHRLMTLSGPDAVKRAVAAGLGIGLLARIVVADELESGQLAALRPTPPVGGRDVLLVDHPQKHHGAACSAMLGLLTVS